MIYKRKPKNFSPSFEVVGCFLELSDKILLLKRLEYKSQGGKWGLPGGKLDKDEDKITAMIREIQEETGINIKPSKLKFFRSAYAHHSSDFVYHMFSYQLLQLNQIKISSKEHADYKWVSINEALSLPFVDDLDTCIRMFYSTRS